MRRDLDSINSGQLLTFVFATQLGYGILTLPRLLTTEVGPDGWACIILAAALVGVGVILIGLLQNKLGASAFEALPAILGKPLGWAVSILLAGYLVFISGTELALFTQVIHIWFFPSTPTWVMAAFLLSPVVYVVAKGLRTLALFDQVIYIIVILLALVPFHGVLSGNVLHLAPVLKTPLSKLASSSLAVSFSMTGFELLLFLYPEITGKKRLIFAGISSIALVTFLYVGAFVSSVLLFGTTVPQHQAYPLLDVARTIRLPVIERVDLFFGGLWITVIGTSLAGLMMISLKALETRLGIRNRWSLGVLSAVVLVTGILPSRFTDVEKMADITGLAGVMVGTALPALLLVISLFRRRAIRKWQRERQSQ